MFTRAFNRVNITHNVRGDSVKIEDKVQEQYRRFKQREEAPRELAIGRRTLNHTIQSEMARLQSLDYALFEAAVKEVVGDRPYKIMQGLGPDDFIVILEG